MDNLFYDEANSLIKIYKNPKKKTPVDLAGESIPLVDIDNLISYRARKNIYMIIALICMFVKIIFSLLEILLKINITHFIKISLSSAMIVFFILYFLAYHYIATIILTDGTKFNANISKEQFYLAQKVGNSLNFNNNTTLGAHINSRGLTLAQKGNLIMLNGKIAVTNSQKKPFFKSSANFSGCIDVNKTININHKTKFNPLPLLIIIIGTVIFSIFLCLLIYTLNIFKHDVAKDIEKMTPLFFLTPVAIFIYCLSCMFIGLFVTIIGLFYARKIISFELRIAIDANFSIYCALSPFKKAEAIELINSIKNFNPITLNAMRPLLNK